MPTVLFSFGLGFLIMTSAAPVPCFMVILNHLNPFTPNNPSATQSIEIQGAASLLTALPAGWAADRYSRAMIISVGGIAMLFSVACVAYSIIISVDDNPDTSYIFLAIGLVFLGFSQGIINGPCQALLADSLPTGFREKYYNYIFVCYIIGRFRKSLNLI